MPRSFVDDSPWLGMSATDEPDHLYNRYRYSTVRPQHTREVRPSYRYAPDNGRESDINRRKEALATSSSTSSDQSSPDEGTPPRKSSLSDRVPNPASHSRARDTRQCWIRKKHASSTESSQSKSSVTKAVANIFFDVDSTVAALKERRGASMSLEQQARTSKIQKNQTAQDRTTTERALKKRPSSPVPRFSLPPARTGEGTFRDRKLVIKRASDLPPSPVQRRTSLRKRVQSSPPKQKTILIPGVHDREPWRGDRADEGFFMSGAINSGAEMRTSAPRSSDSTTSGSESSGKPVSTARNASQQMPERDSFFQAEDLEPTGEASLGFLNEVEPVSKYWEQVDLEPSAAVIVDALLDGSAKESSKVSRGSKRSKKSSSGSSPVKTSVKARESNTTARGKEKGDIVPSRPSVPISHVAVDSESGRVTGNSDGDTRYRKATPVDSHDFAVQAQADEWVVDAPGNFSRQSRGRRWVGEWNAVDWQAKPQDHASLLSRNLERRLRLISMTRNPAASRESRLSFRDYAGHSRFSFIPIALSGSEHPQRRPEESESSPTRSGYRSRHFSRHGGGPEGAGPFETQHTKNPDLWSPASLPEDGNIWNPETSSLRPLDSVSNLTNRVARRDSSSETSEQGESQNRY